MLGLVLNVICDNCWLVTIGRFMKSMSLGYQVLMCMNFKPVDVDGV